MKLQQSNQTVREILSEIHFLQSKRTTQLESKPYQIEHNLTFNFYVLPDNKTVQRKFRQAKQTKSKVPFDLYSLLGNRITQLRKNKGYTSQETFSYDADIPRALYNKYEMGTNLTVKSLYSILKFHGITFSEFFSKGFENL